MKKYNSKMRWYLLVAFALFLGAIIGYFATQQLSIVGLAKGGNSGGTTYACSDRQDNDSDGLCDFTGVRNKRGVLTCAADPGCSSDIDIDESNSAPVTEICNGIDDDSDGQIDEGGVCPNITYYCDADGDNYKKSTSSGTCSSYNCVPSSCITTVGNDCVDTDASINPGATEICDNLDNDCDGEIDEGGVCDNTDTDTTGGAVATPLSTTERNLMVTKIASVQFTNTSLPSYGAITNSNSYAVYVSGVGYRRVIPYFSHIAVLGVLESDHPDKLIIAQRWMQWYLSHINPTYGVPYDTWYTINGTNETTCPDSTSSTCNTIDAEDSSAALFLSVVDKYIAEGGDVSFVNSHHSEITAVENTLISLIEPDGLAWARESYHIKYLMDNVENLDGLGAAIRLNQNVFNDSARANQLQTHYNNMNNALYGSTESFHDNSNNRFYWYKGNTSFGTINMTIWYPDIEAQFWPYAFDQFNNSVVYDNAKNALLITTGDCAVLATRTGADHHPVVAYAMRRQGDSIGSTLTYCMYNDIISDSTYHVAELGWLLMD